MLHVDLHNALAKIIGTHGITDQDLNSCKTSLTQAVRDWKSELQKGEHSWVTDIDQEATIKAVRASAKRLKDLGVQTVVWIGIGGSGLGPRVLQDVFETPETMEFVVVDTIDPAVLLSFSTIIDWKKSAIVVVSKSGETLESMAAFFHCYELLKHAVGKKAAQRVVAVTDPAKGSLLTLALREGFERLPITPETGGRYSIFTPVGLLPMALLTSDLSKFLQGAADMRELCLRTTGDNPAITLAAVQYLLERRKGALMRVIMPYSTRLQNLARWDQQLIAESLGKNEIENPFPVAAIGTQDQHSLLQQWMQGPRKAWHLFIHEVEMPRLSIPKNIPAEWKILQGKTFGDLLKAFYVGTSGGLTAAKRPNASISISRLDAYHLGQLFFLFMSEVVLLGKLYRISPYGQPGVELSKTLAREVLQKEMNA